MGIPFGSDPTIDCGPAPTAGENPGIVCVRCGGEFAVGLASEGSVHVGFVTLQPGAWGRFGDLPVLKSGSDMIQRMGPARAAPCRSRSRGRSGAVGPGRPC